MKKAIIHEPDCCSCDRRWRHRCWSLAAAAHAAAPGITGPTFNLTAQPAYLNQPDGNAVYSWGYGCNGTPAGFRPAAIANADLQPRCRFPARR